MNLFLCFPGNAAEAIEFYLHALPGSEILEITHYPNSSNVLNAQLKFNDETIMFMDLDDCPPFSRSASVYIEAESEEQFHEMLRNLEDGGMIMMGPEPAGKMALVSWVTDRFGLTWQLAWEG